MVGVASISPWVIFLSQTAISNDLEEFHMQSGKAGLMHSVVAIGKP